MENKTTTEKVILVKDSMPRILCNLADLGGKGNIITKKINGIIEGRTARIGELEEEYADASKKLNAAIDMKSTLSLGPEAFEEFIASFRSNKVLLKYLDALGVGNVLDPAIAAHQEEENTKKKANECADNISRYDDMSGKMAEEKRRLTNQLEELKGVLKKATDAAKDLKLVLQSAMDNKVGSLNNDFLNKVLEPVFAAADKVGIRLTEDNTDSFVKKAFIDLLFPDKLEKDYVEATDGMAGDLHFVEAGGEVKKEEPGIEAVSLTGISIDDAVEEPKYDGEDAEAKVLEEDNITSDLNPFEEVESEDISYQAQADDEMKKSNTSEVAIEDDEGINEEPVKDGNIVSNSAEDKMNDVAKELANEVLVLDESRMNPQLAEMVEKCDKEVLNKNVETLKALLPDDSELYNTINVDGKPYSYVTDVDLVSKINYLRGLGVTDHVIASSVQLHYLVCNLAKLKGEVKTIEQREGNKEFKFDPKYIPVFRYGVENLFKALDVLAGYGITLNDKELDPNMIILAKYCDNVGPDMEVLARNSISLLRKNGTYELGVFVKRFDELEKNIGSMVESNGEELLLSPEILKYNTDVVLERSSYLVENGSEPSPKIITGPFNRQFDYPQLSSLPSMEKNNEELDNVNPLCSIIREILDKAYKDGSIFRVVELSPEAADIIQELMGKFEADFGAEAVSERAYKVGDLLVYKHKFDRNLTYLVSALLDSGEDLLAEADEVLLASAFYNSQTPWKTLVDKVMRHEGNEYQRGVAA